MLLFALNASTTEDALRHLRNDDYIDTYDASSIQEFSGPENIRRVLDEADYAVVLTDGIPKFYPGSIAGCEKENLTDKLENACGGICTALVELRDFQYYDLLDL